jgi:phosphoglucomutase
MEIDSKIMEKAKIWLGSEFDEQTRLAVENLIKNDPKELTESFYRDLEFGTGGLRGIMGVGTNRMNKYTVGMATQGLANYIKKCFPDEERWKAAIAYDCRNNSKFFAQITAEILSANNFEVYLFDVLMATPLLSYAVRHYHCHTGVVVTASHNPKEYNGYKAYWNDGAQMVAPHDTNVIEEVQKIKNVGEINFQKVPELIHIIGEETVSGYMEKIKTLSLSPEAIQKHSNSRIVFTPIHGTCVDVVPNGLKAFGFTNIINVPEQDITDGNFPTVYSPNPEEPAALEMALQKAKETDAELIMATDPDGDRVGIAIKNLQGEYELINGNQAASMLIYYLLSQWKKNNKLTGSEYIVKTIVTSELLKKIADDYNVECFDVLTGFKFIGEKIRELEGKRQFIGGGEESYGYLIGDFVRDKDAVIACCFFAEILAWAKDNGLSMYQLLIDIYLKYGFYKEKLISVTKKGKEGMEEIQNMMNKYRTSPPVEINSSQVLLIKDYLTSKETNFKTGTTSPIELPKSNVLQFFLEDGSKITIRPSGTEPKIKFYFGVIGNLDNKSDFENVSKLLDNKLDRLAKEF